MLVLRSRRQSNECGSATYSIAVRCFRAESWMRKAENVPESDIDERFIFLWIAFNALYGQPKYLKRELGCEIYGRDEEMDIKKFLDAICELDRRDQIHTKLKPLKQDIDELTNDLFLNKKCWIEWHKRGLESVAERVKRPFFAGKRGSGLTGLFQSLYVLRNQLFHGGSTEKGTKNREALKRAVGVLDILVRAFHDIAKEHVNDRRLIRLLGELPYPPSVGGVG